MPLLLPPLKQSLLDASKVNTSFPPFGLPANLPKIPIPPIPKIPALPNMSASQMNAINKTGFNINKLTPPQIEEIKRRCGIDMSPPAIPSVVIPPIPSIPPIPDIPKFSTISRIPKLDLQSLLSKWITPAMLIDMPPFGTTIKIPFDIPKLPAILPIPKLPPLPFPISLNLSIPSMGGSGFTLPQLPNISNTLADLTKPGSMISSLPELPSTSLPTLPAIPGLPKIPGMPALPPPSGFPTIPGIPSLTTLPKLSSIPALPGLPGIPAAPTLLKLPGVPTMPALPTLSPTMSTVMGQKLLSKMTVPTMPVIPPFPMQSLSVGDLAKLLQIKLPSASPQFAFNYASAYHRWVMMSMPVMAGPLILDPSKLASGGVAALTAALSAAPFMLGWGPGLIAYWGLANWIGPGFIPLNPVFQPSLLPPFGVSTEIAKLTAGSQSNPAGSLSAGAGRLATVLYTYTMQIKVITTTVVPFGSVVSIVPII